MSFPAQPWGPADVHGTPFGTSEAALDGPGTLKVESIVVADPSPTACLRGGIGSPDYRYRLTMPPGSQSVVRMSSKLLAPPVYGMNRNVTAEIGTTMFGPAARTLESPIGINGPVDPRIIGKIPGSDRFSATNLRPGQKFRIKGTTDPVLTNEMLEIHAEPRIGFSGPPASTLLLTRVKTDGKGRFRTPPVSLRRAGTWVLTSQVDGASEESSSCNGAVEVGRKNERATVRNLDGRQFVSTSIKGPGLPPEKVRIAFIRGTVYGKNSEVVSENGPIMVSDAGCNIMGAGYEVRKGRLRWNQPVSGTAVGCPDSRDSWMYSRLRNGLKASWVGQTLVLKGKRGVRIKLKSRRWFGAR